MKFLFSFITSFAIIFLLLDYFTEITVKINVLIVLISSCLISYSINKAKSNFEKNEEIKKKSL